ncbi:hypothetical protein [Micromonospora sp. HM5-17]|jgi:hypothetical protein|uniref:hypothetical protein n=1 Tax=Micromonospora sp. HM5-17 TaxID=2487710 RepID=UPI000F4A7645|nr:hypothetical protein [Micromonospora sp. HM5-17]ROT28028.1 hypothetical protein EF879_22655 [Micromonospora sp. HM5-17]
MRRVVEYLVTRVLRSRLGLALGIAVLVLGIVGAARLVAGPTDARPPLPGGAVPPISTSDAEAGDDGLTVVEEPSPWTSPGAPEPAEVARAFADAWLRRAGVTAAQWHDGLRPYATEELLDKLAGVDPAGIPAERITGEPRTVPVTDSLVEVVLPVDTGELRLGLEAEEGRWRVDTVNWQRG